MKTCWLKQKLAYGKLRSITCYNVTCSSNNNAHSFGSKLAIVIYWITRSLSLSFAPCVRLKFVKLRSFGCCNVAWNDANNSWSTFFQLSSIKSLFRKVKSLKRWIGGCWRHRSPPYVAITFRWKIIRPWIVPYFRKRKKSNTKTSINCDKSGKNMNTK